MRVRSARSTRSRCSMPRSPLARVSSALDQVLLLLAEGQQLLAGRPEGAGGRRRGRRARPGAGSVRTVSGVRSSWEALATNCRCAVEGRLAAAANRSSRVSPSSVNSSVGGRHPQPVVQVVGGDVAGGGGDQRAAGAAAGRRSASRARADDRGEDDERDRRVSQHARRGCRRSADAAGGPAAGSWVAWPVLSSGRPTHGEQHHAAGEDKPGVQQRQPGAQPGPRRRSGHGAPIR